MARGVLDAFLKCPTAQKLGIRALQWRKGEPEAETRWLRVPFLLAYGGLCRGLRNTAQKTDAEVVRAFAEKMVEFAQQNGQSTREPAQPLPTPARLHEDRTFEMEKEAIDGRVAGSMRTRSHFDQLPFVISAGPLKLKLSNAVIVAARIIAGAKLGDEHYVFPELANIVVANQHGRPLAVYNGAARGNKFVTSGREIFSTDPVQPERIRSLLLQYMGTDNVLVGFHLNWLLTAVEIPVPATRDIDLGLEPAFQNYVKALDASAGGVYDGFFHLHQRVAFDRRWPAYLMKIGLYVEGEDDLIHEAYYTAALWQVVGQQVLNGRGRIDTHRVKSIYVVGYGEDPHDEECRLLREEVDLCCLDTGDGKSVVSKELAVKDEAELMSQCENSGIEVRPAHDKARQQKTRLECLELLDTRELASATSAYSEEFETARPPVRAATNIALASLRMPDETKLMVPWINHHGAKSIESIRKEMTESDGRRIKQLRANPDNMRLFSCFLDFGVSDELMEDALRPRQPFGQEEWTDYGNEAEEAAGAAGSSALVPAPSSSASATSSSVSAPAPAPKIASSTASASTSSKQRNWEPVSMTPVMPGTELEHMDVMASPPRRMGRDSPTRAKTPPIGSAGALGGESPSRRTRSQQRSLGAAALDTTPK
jgi:hypothetical protein